MNVVLCKVTYMNARKILLENKIIEYVTEDPIYYTSNSKEAKTDSLCGCEGGGHLDG